MYYKGECGAQIEMYGDPDDEVIIQCAMGRSLCCNHSIYPEEICEDCSMRIED